DFGLEVGDFASCTTDSGSNNKTMCVNHASRVGIEWDWCVSHMANKAREHGLGTAADPAKSKKPAARELIQKVIKMVQRLNKSSTWRAQLEDIQAKLPDMIIHMMDDLGMFLKIVKHTPQRWLSLTRSFRVVICLWHQLRKLHALRGNAFP
ncbi:unnamed protein product, partial [Sphacelaria rigidula]